MLKTTTATLPAHWASYLINADDSSFSLFSDGDEELELIDRLCKEEGFGHCLGCTEEAEFTLWHDATRYGVLAGDCLTYTFEFPGEAGGGTVKQVEPT